VRHLQGFRISRLLNYEPEGREFRISQGAPLILLESNSCNETNIWCFRPFPSIPSNHSVFGKILGRNLESKARFFGPFPAESGILANFVVEVAHVFVLPTQPKLPHSLGTRRAVFQVGIAKTTEGFADRSPNSLATLAKE